MGKIPILWQVFIYPPKADLVQRRHAPDRPKDGRRVMPKPFGPLGNGTDRALVSTMAIRAKRELLPAILSALFVLSAAALGALYFFATPKAGSFELARISHAGCGEKPLLLA